LDAETLAYRKASLERQITYLEKSVAEKRQAALPAKRISDKLDTTLISNEIVIEKSLENSVQNPTEERILAELDELSFKVRKSGACGGGFVF
jgi:hypothetical protein